MDSKIDLRKIEIDNLKTIDLDAVDVNLESPEHEPERQYYFMAKCREYVRAESERLGRPLFCVTRTFGCQMNAKDSEKLAGILSAIGYREAKEEEADFVLYNTCTVRKNANDKIYGRLGYLGSLKKKNPDMLIALCGCMMQEAQAVETIQKSYPFVDIIFGTHNIYKLAELLYIRLTNLSGGMNLSNKTNMVIDVLEDAGQIVEELPDKRAFCFKAGVNIMYGCNNFCSYCIVPYVRGRERSRKPLDVIAEIEGMAKEGVTEVMLLGQNVNSYGKTFDVPVSFADLLRMAETVEGIRRIRFMTPHPKDLSDALIEMMKQSDKVCRHIHLPLQSGSTRLLERMNRKYSKEDYLALTERIRAAMPDVSLTTDIIVGFPGETEEDFRDTLDVVEKARFSSAYTFLYSPRVGTPAAVMPDPVPKEVAKERFARLLDTLQRISAELAKQEEGKIAEVLVEEKNAQEGLMTGRLRNNLLVHFPGEESLLGKYINVKLKESKGFYYIGEIC